MPENKIYKFLKDNDLTDKNEAEFVNEYSDPEKAKKIYSFFSENNLTEKDPETFYNDYFKKKSSVQGLLPESGQLPSVGERKAIEGEGFRQVKAEEILVSTPERPPVFEMDEKKLIAYQKNEASKRAERVKTYTKYIDSILPGVEGDLEKYTDLYEANQDELRSLMFKGDRRTPQEEQRYQSLYDDMQSWFDKNTNLSSVKNLLEDSRRYINTGNAGILESMYKSKPLADFLSLGLNQVLSGFDVLSTAKKFQSGEQLNEDEQLKLFAYGLNQMVNEDVEQGLRSMVGSGIVETIPFMVQFAMSGPTSAVAKESAEKAVTMSLKRIGNEQVKKIVAKSIGGLVEGMVRTPQLLDFYEGIAERQIGTIRPEMRDGRLIGVPIAETQASPLEATRKAFMNTMVTATVENFGEGFDKLFSKAMKLIPDTPMVNRIGSNTIDQIRTAVGLQSWMSEYLEEVLESYGQAAITGDQKLSNVWDNKQMLATLITTGIISKSFTGANYIVKGNIDDKAMAVKNLRESEQRLGAARTAEVDRILKGDDVKANASQLDTYIKIAISKGATPQDIKDILNYVANVSGIDSMNEIEASAQEEISKAVVKEETKPTVGTKEEIAKETMPVEEKAPEKAIKEEIIPTEEKIQPPIEETQPTIEEVEPKITEHEKEKLRPQRGREKGGETVTTETVGKKTTESQKDEILTSPEYFGLIDLLGGAKTGKELNEAFASAKLPPTAQTKFFEAYNVGATKTKSKALKEFKNDVKLKQETYAKEQQGREVRGARTGEGQVQGISDKDLSGVYGAKLQDRQKEQERSLGTIGNVQEKGKDGLINEAKSINELDYLLSTGQVNFSPLFNQKKAELRDKNLFEDTENRIPMIEVQRASIIDNNFTKEAEKELGKDRVSELKQKKGELWDSVSNRLGKIANLKFAVGEGGKAPDAIKEIAGVIRDLAELGIINLELGTRSAIEKLKKYIGQGAPEVLGTIDENYDLIDQELQKGAPKTPPLETTGTMGQEIPEEGKIVEKPVPEGQKRRRAAQQILENTKLKEEIRQGLSGDAINYVPVSNETTESEATAIIKVKKALTGNHDQSVLDVTRTDNKIPPRIRVTMAAQLINELNSDMKTADPALKEKLQNDAINVAETITKFGTELGQGVQAFNIWAKLNGESVISKFNKDLEKILGRKMTKEEEDKLKKLHKRVKAAKEGFQKIKAIHDMLAYQMRIEGIKWNDVGMSVWYAHVLSGYSTQMLNAFANITETSGEILTSMIYSPKRAPWLLKGLFSGYGRGILEAWATLKTGYAPVKSIKLDMSKEGPSVLEAYQGFKMFGRAWNPFKFHKYVARTMNAVDTFFYHGLKGMRTYELAHMAIRGQGKGAQETNRLINEKLGHTKERLLKAKEIAKLEANENIMLLRAEKGKLVKDLKEESDPRKKEIIQKEVDRIDQEIALGPSYKVGSLDYKRRIWELMEESLPDQMLDDANNIASRGTFNYASEGRLGMLSDSVAAISNKKGLGALKFVVPFTRIVSNVANRYLDWTPVGFYRGAKGGIGPSPRSEFNNSVYSREYTPEEQAKEFIKASLGTLAALTLLALTKPGNDDDETDGPFEVTAAGTGDYRKNYNLQETGWQAYSINIGGTWYSYANTPIAIPLTVIGTIKDMGKYRGENLKEKTTSDKVSLVTWNTFKYFTDLTFLKSLSEFLSYFSEENPGRASKYFIKFGAGAAKSFVVPNLFTQVSRQVQSLMDMPIKEANTVWQQFYRDIPVARKGLNDMVNGLGEPIVPNTDRYTRETTSDPIWEVITENNAWVMKPSKDVRVYDPETGDERSLDNDEYYAYSKLRGEKLKSMIEGNLTELQAMDKEHVQEAIKDYKERASIEAKGELLLGKVSFGLNKVKSENPKAYEALKKYQGFFEPATSKSIWIGKEKRFMDKGELDSYRKLALDKYIIEAGRATNNFDDKKMEGMSRQQYIIKNKTSNYLSERLKVAWAKAEALAYKDIYREIRKAEKTNK